MIAKAGDMPEGTVCLPRASVSIEDRTKEAAAGGMPEGSVCLLAQRFT